MTVSKMEETMGMTMPELVCRIFHLITMASLFIKGTEILWKRLP
jgi:hypothetical protein